MAAVAPVVPVDTRVAPQTIVIKTDVATNLLDRLARPRPDHDAPQDSPVCLPVPSGPVMPVENRWNAALGCKTSEVAMALLVQVVGIERPAPNASEEVVDHALMSATAMVAELEPATATEAMLAAQMVGAQRAAMRFLGRALLEGQTTEGIDANVSRAARLMRLFNEQTETMIKLKGKSGQQRVVVEHVTVTAGGQAIVGNVTARGGMGASGGDQR